MRSLDRAGARLLGLTGRRRGGGPQVLELPLGSVLGRKGLGQFLFSKKEQAIYFFEGTERLR